MPPGRFHEPENIPNLPGGVPPWENAAFSAQASVWRAKWISTPFGKRRLRPRWRRRLKMARPALVAMRARKPNCCLRVRLEGW